MKCPVTEEQLALYAGSDLSVEESSAVAQHLAECLPCRETLADFQFARQLLSETPRLPREADLAPLRSSVVAQLRGQRNRTRWIQTAGLAASLALVSIPFLHRERVRPHQETVPVASIRPPYVPVPEVHHQEPVHRRAAKPVRLKREYAKRRPELRAIAFDVGTGDKPVLKLATADPNVVILIQMNGNSHEN
jgi:anti-sigma factor RsiW